MCKGPDLFDPGPHRISRHPAGDPDPDGTRGSPLASGPSVPALLWVSGVVSPSERPGRPRLRLTPTPVSVTPSAPTDTWGTQTSPRTHVYTQVCTHRDTDTYKHTGVGLPPPPHECK